MASKRRIRRKSCTRKIRYRTEDEAHHAARQMNGKGKKFKWLRGRVWPYKCKFCKGWHIGHMPKRVKRAIRARQRAKLLNQ